jgi:entericidin B
MFEHRVCAPSARLHAAWLLGLAAAGMLALSIGGCNTMSGMGEDVQAAGSAVHNTAEDTKQKME